MTSETEILNSDLELKLNPEDIEWREKISIISPRRAKVELLKARVRSGKYQADSEEVARVLADKLKI